MGLNLKAIGRKLEDVFGGAVDAVIPGDQSYLHNGSSPGQVIHQAANQASGTVRNVLRAPQQAQRTFTGIVSPLAHDAQQVGRIVSPLASRVSSFADSAANTVNRSPINPIGAFATNLSQTHDPTQAVKASNQSFKNIANDFIVNPIESGASQAAAQLGHPTAIPKVAGLGGVDKLPSFTQNVAQAHGPVDKGLAVLEDVGNAAAVAPIVGPAASKGLKVVGKAAKDVAESPLVRNEAGSSSLFGGEKPKVSVKPDPGPITVERTPQTDAFARSLGVEPEQAYNLKTNPRVTADNSTALSRGVANHPPVDIRTAPGIDSVPFNNRPNLIGLDPQRAVRQMTKDVTGRQLLHDVVVKPQDSALARANQELVSHRTNLRGILQDAGLTNTRGTNRKLSSHFYDFVEKGGSKSPEAVSNLVGRVGAKRAQALSAADTKLRPVLDQLFQEQNNARAATGNPLIAYRENYLTHLRDQGFFGDVGLSGEVSQAGDTGLPGGRLNPFGKKREGAPYKKDIGQALDAYVHAAVREKHSVEPVVKLNNLIDNLSKRGDVPQSTLNYLERQRDIIAGRGTGLDRLVKGNQVGAPLLKASSKAVRQTGQAVIGLNANTVLTQPVSLAYAIARLGPINTLRGMVKATLSPGAIRKESEFLRGRHAEIDKIAPGLKDKLIKASFWPVDKSQRAVDLAVREAAKYRAGRLGLKGEEAAQWADRATKEVVTARGLGQTPHVFQSQTLSPITQFGIEMHNVLMGLAHDELRGGRIGGIALYSLSAHGFNQLYGAITNRDQGIAFDPLQAGIDIAGDVAQGKFAAAAGRLPGEVIANEAGGGLVVEGSKKVLGEKTSQALFNQSGAGRYGVGVPVVSLAKAGVNAGRDPGSAAAYLAPGGVPIRRAIKGAKSVVEGQATDTQGNKLYNVDATASNFVRATLFGQGTTAEGKTFNDKIAQWKKTFLENKPSDSTNAKKYMAYFAREKDSQGRTIGRSPLDAADDAGALLTNDSLRAAIQNQYRSQKDHDPKWDLSDDKLKAFLSYENYLPGSAERWKLTQDNPWIDDFFQKRQDYFNGLEQNGKFVKNPQSPDYPKFDDQTKTDLKVYDSVTDKATFLADHPNVIEAFRAMGKYTNAVRVARKAPELDDYPEATPQVKAILTEYDSLPQHDGKKGGNASRAIWKKNNPDKASAMNNYFATLAVYNLAREGAKVELKDVGPTQDFLKNAYNLGQYDIAKSPDGKTFSIDPVAASAQGSFGGSGKSRGFSHHSRKLSFKSSYKKPRKGSSGAKVAITKGKGLSVASKTGKFGKAPKVSIKKSMV